MEFTFEGEGELLQLLGAALQRYLQQGSRLRQFNTVMGGLLAVTALGKMWV